MDWRLRLASAYAIAALLFGLTTAFAGLLLDSQTDRDFVLAVVQSPMPIFFFLVYYLLPGLLGRTNPPNDLQLRNKDAARSQWRGGWWWKWLLLALACAIELARSLGHITFNWQIRQQISPTTDFFPIIVPPEVRRTLLRVGSWRSLLAMFASACQAAAFYLFWRDWRKPRQFLQGFCRACGYDLTGNLSGTCPECGTPLQKS